MSTWRLTSLRGAATAITWRLTSLRGVGIPLGVELVTMTGSTKAEPNETVTIVAVTTSGTPASWTFLQTGGSAIVFTGSGASRTFVAPALTNGTILTLQVTATQAGAADAVATLEIEVWSAAEFIFDGSVWQPRVDYIL